MKTIYDFVGVENRLKEKKNHVTIKEKLPAGKNEVLI
jgi:hypothetical protein